MSGDRDEHLTLLERLDLALAARATDRQSEFDPSEPEGWPREELREDPSRDSAWISQILGLRGFEIGNAETFHILYGSSVRQNSASQEARLVRGVQTVLRTIREHAADGRPPDGWLAVELFRQLTSEIARFRGNALRRDLPWDGVTSVRYPTSDEIPPLLETFCEAKHYGDSPEEFVGVHPVRQAVRLLWRFGRIAPFPDFNHVMAFVLMDAFLLAKGYPMVVPRPADRALMCQLVTGPTPKRLVQFESRLVEIADAPPAGA